MQKLQLACLAERVDLMTFGVKLTGADFLKPSTPWALKVSFTSFLSTLTVLPAENHIFISSLQTATIPPSSQPRVHVREGVAQGGVV